MVNGSYFFFWNTKFWLHWGKKSLVTLQGLKFKGCQYKMKKKIKLLKKIPAERIEPSNYY